MRFNTRVHEEFQVSVHHFAGDDAISPQQYRCSLAGGYVSSVSTIMGAATGLRLTVDAETFERWKRMCAAAGLLDDLLDESPNTSQAYRTYTHLVTYLQVSPKTVSTLPDVDEPLSSAVALLHNSVASLPERRLQRLTTAAQAIGHVAMTKANCQHIDEYIGLLKDEAYYSSALVHDAASNAVRAQASFAAFIGWSQNAMELGTLADSSRDIWADRRAGRSGIEATILNSARIALQLRRPILAMLYPRYNLRATCSSLRYRCKFLV